MFYRFSFIEYLNQHTKTVICMFTFLIWKRYIFSKDKRILGHLWKTHYNLTRTIQIFTIFNIILNSDTQKIVITSIFKWMHITISAYTCMDLFLMYSLFVGHVFKTAQQRNRCTLVSKHTLILNIYPWLTRKYLLPNRCATHTQTQVGRVISPSSYAHVLALVKFKLQTPTEHLSLSQPGFLVVFLLLNLQFYVYS